MTPSEKLKVIQGQSGFTQERLARELGVSFVTLNSWMRGRSMPRDKAQGRIDDLYRAITGQKIIPKEALQAKLRILKKKRGEHGNVLKTILTERDLYDQFVLSLTYNTNRIEGSTLTEPETAAILFQNVSLPDKTLVEQMEVKNHQAALEFLFRSVQKREAIDQNFILKSHRILLNGIQSDAGAYRNHPVRIVGSRVVTANYAKVPTLMRDLETAIHEEGEDAIAHVSRIHSRFEKIHPFSDGNGRIGRLLMHRMLLDKSYPPAVIRQEEKRLYMTYLAKAQLEEDDSLLTDFVCDAVLAAYRILERS
jgi:Fic family protein